MTDKRRESYSLDRIKAAFNEPGGLNRTFSATLGAEDLGMDEEAVVAVLQGLTKADFDKSMTSHLDVRVWQDVYRPTVGGCRLYVKFTIDAQQDLLLISFKEA